MNKSLIFALLALCVAASASASSTAASSASDSVGSLSNSLGTSSESSTGQAEVRTGAYVLVQLQPVPELPGQQRLALRPVDAEASAPELQLNLPATVVAAQGLQTGQTLHLQTRAYGLALAQMDGQGQALEPFFLALNDPRELANRKL
jgi:hypothetical protein